MKKDTKLILIVLAGIFAGCYFGEGWYGPSPFSFLRSSNVLRKRKLDHRRTRS